MDPAVAAVIDEGARSEDVPISLDDVRQRVHLQASLERMSAYAHALEARCDALWGYLQGHQVSHDPVTRFIAVDHGVDLVDTVGGDAISGAD